MRTTQFVSALCAFFYLAAGHALDSSEKFSDVVSPDYMPPPWQDTRGICHAGNTQDSTASLCDPSRLLSPREEDRLNSILQDIYDGVRPYSLVNCADTASDQQTGLRVAVAMVRRMSFDGRTLDERAETFAKTLFSNWDLGSNCGASVLLFLSLKDQRLYMRTGVLATKYLNEHQIDKVYKKMIPLLKRNRVPEAMVAGVNKIGSYLRKYEGQHGGAQDTNPAPKGPSVPLFFRGGPSWWDFELSLIAAIFGVFAVIACCNGVGGREATRRKREKREVLRKLNLVRSEYMQAMLPQYVPATCPMCHDDLLPSWVPAVPVLSENESLTESQTAPARPLRDLRCGHKFHESCFDDEQPTPSSAIPECPLCGDRGGGTSTPPSLSSTRGQDVTFRLKKLQDLYPHILTDDVIAKLSSEPPNLWPENMTEAYLKPQPFSERSALPSPEGERRNRHGCWGWGWGNIGGLVAAGGIGALIANAFSGWGSRRSGDYYTDIPNSGGGGHVGQWGSGNNTEGGGGHGAGWSDVVGGNNQGAGGHGASWGDTLGNAVSHISGGGWGGGWGSGNGGGSSGGGGGQGSGW